MNCERQIDVTSPLLVMFRDQEEVILRGDVMEKLFIGLETH